MIQGALVEKRAISGLLQPQRRSNDVHRAAVYDALLTSDVPLPVSHETALERLHHKRYCPVAIRYCPGALQQFRSISWINFASGGGLRSYAVPTGLLLCIQDRLRVLVHKSGASIQLDYDHTDTRLGGLAASISINLALSISSLFRGRVPIHAAAVSINGSVVGIMAPSGTGKSTLLSRLLESGIPFVTDDVLVVDELNGMQTCFPSLSLHAKIDQDIVTRRGLDPERLMELIPDSGEYWVSVPASERVTSIEPLGCLFLLSPLAFPKDPRHLICRQARPEECLPILLANTQGIHSAFSAIDSASLRHRLVLRLDHIANSVPIFVIEYARSLQILPSMVQMIAEMSRIYKI